MSHKSHIILAIDPGYDRVGWAIIEKNGQKNRLVDADCVQTSRKQSITQRYASIQTELDQIIDRYQPTQLAIESVFFSKNVKTAIRVAEAKGVIIGICVQAGLEVYEYTPPQVKQSVTGYGKSDKKGVEKMVRLLLGLPPHHKMVDDAMDAMAVGLTHQPLHSQL